MLTPMLIDGAILGIGAALAGLVGSICGCQGLDEDRGQGRSGASPGPTGGALARIDLGLSLLAWLAFLAVLLLAVMPSRAGWALLPALLLAALPRCEGLARWLRGMAPTELVELKFAAVMGLLACGSGLAERWMRRPPEGVEPGFAGLWHHFLPSLIGCAVVAALLVVIGWSGSPRRPPRAEQDSAPAHAPR